MMEKVQNSSNSEYLCAFSFQYLALPFHCVQMYWSLHNKCMQHFQKTEGGKAVTKIMCYCQWDSHIAWLTVFSTLNEFILYVLSCMLN
jgi:hypothetical protein